MTSRELAARLTDKGLSGIDSVLVAAWSEEDRMAAEAFINGSPAPDWLCVFDDNDVLVTKPISLPKPKVKQRELF